MATYQNEEEKERKKAQENLLMKRMQMLTGAQMANQMTPGTLAGMGLGMFLRKQFDDWNDARLARRAQKKQADMNKPAPTAAGMSPGNNIPDGYPGAQIPGNGLGNAQAYPEIYQPGLLGEGARASSLTRPHSEEEYYFGGY